jgi:hypothetical protein
LQANQINIAEKHTCNLAGRSNNRAPKPARRESYQLEELQGIDLFFVYVILKGYTHIQWHTRTHCTHAHNRTPIASPHHHHRVPASCPGGLYAAIVRGYVVLACHDVVLAEQRHLRGRHPGQCSLVPVLRGRQSCLRLHSSRGRRGRLRLHSSRGRRGRPGKSGYHGQVIVAHPVSSQPQQSVHCRGGTVPHRSTSWLD